MFRRDGSSVSHGVEISKKLVLINSASSIVTRLFNVGVLVWMYQYLLARISDSEFSLYPVVMAIMIIFPPLTTVLTAGISRYIVEAYARHDEARVTQIVSTMFPMLAAAGVAMLGIGGTLTWFVDFVLKIDADRVSDARLMLSLLVVIAVLQMMSVPFNCGMNVRQKFVWENLIQVATDLLRIGLLLSLLLGVSPRVLWVVVATFVATIFKLTVSFILSRRLVPALRFDRKAIEWQSASKLTRFGLWSTLGQVAELIRNSADPLILNRLAAPLDVNNFHLGATAQIQIQSLALTATAPLQPAMTAMHAVGSTARLRNVYLTGGRYALWTVMLISTPLMIFHREIMTLYVGHEYAEAGLVMLLLLGIFPIGYGSAFIGKIAVATAQIGPLTTRLIGIQCLNLALTFYLVGGLGFGAIGSAMSTYLVFLVCYPLMIWPLGCRLTDTPLMQFFRETVFPGLAPAMIAGLVALAMQRFVGPTTWTSLGLCAATVGIVYLLVLWRFCLQPYDRATIAQVISRLSRSSPERGA